MRFFPFFDMLVKRIIVSSLTVLYPVRSQLFSDSKEQPFSLGSRRFLIKISHVIKGGHIYVKG